jgi:Domain of unknown function (DUF4345)
MTSLPYVVMSNGDFDFEDWSRFHGGRSMTVSRSLLQLGVAIGAMVPVATGAFGVLGGFVEVDGGLASHERYLSGLLLAIGIAFWSTIQGIERKTRVFRLLTLLVVGGGLCRLLGVALGDALRWPVGGALFMELVVTPLLCVWQGRLAARWPVVMVSNRATGVDAGGIQIRFRRLREAIVDRSEAIFAKLYCPHSVDPPATYTRPDRSKHGLRGPHVEDRLQADVGRTRTGGADP